MSPGAKELEAALWESWRLSQHYLQLLLEGYRLSDMQLPPPTLQMLLESSVGFQSDLGALLNELDGGQRMEFTAAAWLERLAELKRKGRTE